MSIETKWKIAGAALVVASVVIAASVYLLQQEPAQEQTAVAPQNKQESARFGPGLMTDAKPLPNSQTPEAPAADPWAPEGLEVAPDQHLVINKGLRLVFDYFLQPANPGDRTERLAKLQAHLKAKLPAGALAEALPIASNYVTYLVALDAQNANDKEPLPRDSIPTSYSGIEHMKAKLAETSRLRQSILGVSVAHAWFADEETGVQIFLARRGQTPKVVLPQGAR